MGRWPTLVILGAIILSAVAVARAKPVLPGPVMAAVLRVVDGDTLEVRAEVWPGHDVTVLVRINGIDAPEMRGRCDRERGLAARARDFLAARAGAEVQLTEVRHDKYGGRVVAQVAAADGTDLGGALIAAGLARAYAGSTRAPWCETARAG